VISYYNYVYIVGVFSLDESAKQVGSKEFGEAKSSDDYHLIWQPMFKKLVTFAEKHAHDANPCKIPQKQEPKLYTWFRRQILTLEGKSWNEGREVYEMSKERVAQFHDLIANGFLPDEDIYWRKEYKYKKFRMSLYTIKLYLTMSLILIIVVSVFTYVYLGLYM